MSRLPPHAEAEIERRLALLTAGEKVGLLTGDTAWTTRAVPRIGLRAVVFADGPAGVQGPDPESSSTSLPAPTALAATWDTTLAARAGAVFAAEARRKGVDVVLAPVLNLQRTPVGGRHFESFSEDPILTAHIGATLIASMQSHGVGACAKHFVANDSETDRTSYVARVEMKALREAYLLPFHRAIASADVWTVMAAYNQVDHGSGAAPMTEHRSLLRDVLKGEWQFDGVVVSDWEATRSTVASAVGGLDLVMPGPGGPWEVRLDDAVRAGEVPMSIVDDKVRRLLRLAARVGKLDGVRPGAPASRSVGAAPRAAPSRSLHDGGTEDAATFSRHLGAAAMVVLRRGTAVPLPLWDAHGGPAPESIAVVGANALEPFVQGGGSAHVNAPYEISPFEGLRAALEGSSTSVHWTRGGRTLTKAPLLTVGAAEDGAVAPDVRLELLDAARTLLSERTVASADLTWMRDLTPETAIVGLRATVTLTEPGTHVLELGSIGRHRVWLDGGLVAEVIEDRGVGAVLDSSVNAPAGRATTVEVGAGGRVVRLRAELDVTDAGGYGRLVSATLRHRPPEPGADREIAAAAQLAARSDVAVVVVGTNGEVESEGWDRGDLRLPGHQDRLVRAVLAANPRTMVVVNAGAPVELPWLEEVPTVLWAWLPGQEFGHALADVLMGRAEPAGRLPWTLPSSHADVPVPRATPVEGIVSYDEGALVGYRGWSADGPAPAAPLGHGLGWSSWDYLDLDVAAHDGRTVVSVTVRNAGPRTASEVVQVYAVGEHTQGGRLAGFAVARQVPAGHTTTVTVEVDEAVLEHWDDDIGRMRRAQGPDELLVGRSSTDIRLRHRRDARAVLPVGLGREPHRPQAR